MKTALRYALVFLVAPVSGLLAQTTPLRIEQTVEAQFPATLAMSNLSEGEARVVIHVDADGRLADLLVTGYTDKAFAREAVDALRQWRYVAATEHGRPIGIRTELRFDFHAIGKVVTLQAIDTPEVLARQAGIRPALLPGVCEARELDHPIAPVNPGSPPNPGVAAIPAGRHSVLVDFYVDETGLPRMPVVIDSPHLALAQAAVSALNQWRFTIPTRLGKPVAVRVRQEFIFPASS